MDNVESTDDHIRDFAKDESGSMTLFTLFMVIMMVMVGGIGVDLMHAELDRVHRQQALDRALLAAADLDQTLEPEEVIRDYFKKSGLDGQASNIKVTTSSTNRVVSAESLAQVPTSFMAALGNPDLASYATGSASEVVPNVEISLVLDISGSMRYSDRMTELRPAARNFIDSVIDDVSSKYTSVNLIPYAGQTNVGPFMFNRLNGQRYAQPPLDPSLGGDENGLYPNVSSCLELNSSDFGHSGLPLGASYDQTPHFMNWTIASDVMDWGWCPQDQSSIVYASNNKTDLKDLVTNMRMHDGTGTAYAMKYALALLDPTSQPHFAAMAGAGLMPSQFANRPAQWNSPQTTKYIILMTDGQITEQKRPVDALAEENPTVELQNRDKSDNTQVSSSSTNVSRFYQSCDLAKSASRNVTVYTIAFEAPAAAVEQMQKCASSASHFYNVDSSEINDVFQAIARQVRQLRLTN
ncbi:MAG: VWA domain-containing protein [Pseudomonadota bacterium]